MQRQSDGEEEWKKEAHDVAETIGMVRSFKALKYDRHSCLSASVTENPFDLAYLKRMFADESLEGQSMGYWLVHPALAVGGGENDESLRER
jgi:hypothetical protein